MDVQVETTQAPPRRFARLTGAMRGALDLVAGIALPQLCPSCREPGRGSGTVRSVLVEALIHHAALL